MLTLISGCYLSGFDGEGSRCGTPDTVALKHSAEDCFGSEISETGDKRSRDEVAELGSEDGADDRDPSDEDDGSEMGYH